MSQQKKSRLDSISLKGKAVAVPTIAGVVFLGRMVSTSTFKVEFFENATVDAVLYSLYAALSAYFAIDLVLARGLLQRKVLASKVLLAGLMLLIAGNAYVFPHFQLSVTAIQIAEVGASAIIFGLLLWFDKTSDVDFLVDASERIPKRYLTAHPLRTALETIFRLFPYPVPVGLYKIGSPGDEAPVFVTGNFELTVRRVAKGLKNIDCLLLVCDSRGINNWCSTLANHFNERKVIEAIEVTGLKNRTATRKLVLPQLCAGNLNTEKIREETGFKAVFGPVHIRDIRKYLDDRKNEAVRLVTFSLRERLEMGFATIIIPMILLTLVFNFIDLEKLLILIPGVYMLSLLNSALYPVRPIRNIPIWSLLFGGAVLGSVYLLSSAVGESGWSVYTISLSISIVYSVNEFEGWSPMVKYAMFSRYKMPEASIDENACIGCRRCIEVCPRGVYQMQYGKSTIAHLERCISCKACYAQCSTNAIEHSSQKVNNFL